MRFLVVRGSSLDQHFSLTGVSVTPVFEKKVNPYNTVVIDKSFTHDFVISFPDYILEVHKILNGSLRRRRDRIFELNNCMFYNKKFDNTIVNDLAICLKKDDFKKVSTPYIDQEGRIRMVVSPYSNELMSTIKILRSPDLYLRLRSVIFNVVTLPYIRELIL